MAQPKNKESQASPVGHAMIADTLGISILQCDLLEEIQSLHKEVAWLQGKDRIRAYKRRWISVVEMTEQRALDRANAVLRRGGIAEKAIEAHYCNLVDASRATNEILGLARLRKCDTVVIGRKSLSWLGELIHGDPAEELVRQGKGFTIWVVE